MLKYKVEWQNFAEVLVLDQRLGRFYFFQNGNIQVLNISTQTGFVVEMSPDYSKASYR